MIGPFNRYETDTVRTYYVFAVTFSPDAVDDRERELSFCQVFRKPLVFLVLDDEY